MPDTVQRVCFVMNLKPDLVEDYLAVHENVWPEMLGALRDAGWRNYSLFLRRDDGMVVGYLETDDFDRATAEMERTEINARWQAQMSRYFQPAAAGADNTAGANPDTIRHQLSEYFHLS